MLGWVDGLVRKGRRELREVPQKYVWAQTLWVTRRGELYKRFYNVGTNTWHWGDEAEELVEDNAGKMGYRLAGRGWVSLEYVVASAWRRRKMGSNAPVERQGRRRALTAKSLRWGDESDGEDSEGDDEVWAPLNCRCGVVKTEGSGYQISNRGRLKSPFTALVTRGSAYLSCRYAACRNIGLINLTVAAGLQEAPQPPNYLTPAIDCLMSGDHPETLAIYSKIKERTAWTYFCQAAHRSTRSSRRGASSCRRCGKTTCLPIWWLFCGRSKTTATLRLGAGYATSCPSCSQESPTTATFTKPTTNTASSGSPARASPPPRELVHRLVAVN